MESTEYTASIPSEAPVGVPDESLDRTERRNTGIEDTPDGFLRKRRCWRPVPCTLIIVYGSGCQSGRGYGLTHGKERPVSVGELPV